MHKEIRMKKRQKLTLEFKILRRLLAGQRRERFAQGIGSLEPEGEAMEAGY
jgi:hypothetical protein